MVLGARSRRAFAETLTPDGARSVVCRSCNALSAIAGKNVCNAGKIDKRHSIAASRSISYRKLNTFAKAIGAARRFRRISQDRRVEITGPTDRKMVINALNSGAKIFMADFEDANAPTWNNMIEGQINLRDAIRRHDHVHQSGGKRISAERSTGRLIRCARAAGIWTRNICSSMASRLPARLFDFGLYFFHNARELIARGSGPVFLPAENGEPSRSAHLERRFQAGAG